jgi:cytochrome c peroxidase
MSPTDRFIRAVSHVRDGRVDAYRPRTMPNRLCAAAHTTRPVSRNLGPMDDVLSLEEFQVELRRSARFERKETPPDALAATVQNVRENPDFSQSRLLGRIVQALTDGHGEFRRAEVSAFDAPTLRLVVALMNAAVAGTHTRADWLSAAASMHLATKA